MWILLLFVLVVIWYLYRDCKCKRRDIYENDRAIESPDYSFRSDQNHLENIDRREVDRAMNLLYSDQRSIYECKDRSLNELVNSAYLISAPTDDLVEQFTPDSTGDENTWERFYYSNPFNYRTGWMYDRKTGMKKVDTVRNRWVRKTVGNRPLYFYINNM